MDETFDLVMITERFDESLILLKDLMGISTEQITYISLYERFRKLSYDNSFEQSTESEIRRRLHADNAIYQHFKHVFEQKIQEFGSERMQAELEELKAKQAELHTECVEKEIIARQSNEHIFVPRKVAMIAWKIKKGAPGFCKYYIYSEKQWLNKFK